MGEQGVVTIMHADVEGSTELTTRLGDDVGRGALETTKRIVRDNAETHGGRQIDAVGDAMMFTFTSTRQAIAGAVAVQRALGAEEEQRPETLRVRIGLNVGEVLERDGHPFGAAVNAGARVMSKASGGQIFASEMVVRLAGTMPGVSFRDRGRHAFKGFDERWRLYEVDWGRPPAPRRAPSRQASWGKRLAARRRAYVAGALAAAAALVAIVAALAFDRDDRTTVVVPENSVAIVSPETNEVEGVIAGVVRPGPVAFGAGSVWVGSLEDRTLVRIDPATKTIVKTIPLLATPDAIAVGEGGVWVVHGRLGTLTRVDPRFDTVVETIPLAGRSISYVTGGVAVGEDAVWAVYGDATLARLDPRTNRRTGSILVGVGPAAALVAFGWVWVANSGEASVQRFSPQTFEEGPVDELTVGGSPAALAAGDGAVWVASKDGDLVTRIDASHIVRGAVPITVGEGPTALASGAGAIWVAEGAERALSRIDARTNRVVDTISLGNAPAGVAYGRGRVWIAMQAP